MALYRSTEYLFSQDQTFLNRLVMSVQRAAIAIAGEANDPVHPQRTQKRQALANTALRTIAQVLPAFAQATVAYAGSPIGAAVDFAYDGHAPVDPTAPTSTETITINKFANNGVSDAQIDTAVVVVWSAVANVLATD